MVLFGDTSSFTNGVNMGAHPYVSRLFAYLADPMGSPQEPARQLGGLLLVLALAVVLVVEPSPLRLALAAVALAVSLGACTAVTHRAWEMLPDGRGGGPGPANNLAYIDEAHLGKFSPESWREDGLMGLCLTLMRNDYLTLMLPELTQRAAARAARRLGIEVGPVPPDAAKLLKIEPNRGVIVTEIERGKAGAILISRWATFSWRSATGEVVTPEEFRQAIESVPLGKNVTLRGVRAEDATIDIPNPAPSDPKAAAKPDMGTQVALVSDAWAKGASGHGWRRRGCDGGRIGQAGSLRRLQGRHGRPQPERPPGQLARAMGKGHRRDSARAEY